MMPMQATQIRTDKKTAKTFAELPEVFAFENLFYPRAKRKYVQ